MSADNNKKFLTYVVAIVKMFVFFGLGVGLLFGIFQSIRRNSFDGFVDGSVVGIVGALILVPSVILLDILQKVKCYLRYKIVDFRTNYERRILVEDDYLSIFDLLCNVMHDNKKMHICQKDVENGVIEAVTKRSWRSFGENITIKLFKSSNSKRTIVVLTSKPRISLTLIDYCKNLENVEIVVNDIKDGGLSLSPLL